MSEQLKNPKYDAAIKAADLTERQATVLELWLRGNSMRSVARALEISEATARGHFDAAIRKIRPHMQPTRKHGNNPEAQASAAAHQQYHTDRVYRHNVKARVGDTAERVSRTQIINRDNRTCHICGKTNLTNAEIHLDHVIPLAAGGPHTADNLKVACAPCNIRKGDTI